MTTSKSRFSLRALIPPLRWWHLVTPGSVKADFMAGLTGAIVVIPQGMAFATIAGMPPIYGLYAGMIPAMIAAFFGSSWHLVSGPTTAASIVLFSLLSPLAEPGSATYVQLAITMTLLVGLTELGLGLMRMGVLVNFISHSVVIGFTSGAAILIASNQVQNFFGVPIPKGSQFHETLTIFFHHLHTINPYILTVSGTTLLSGLLIRKFWPRIPYMIVALALGSLAALAIDNVLDHPSAITYVGSLSGSLPPLSMPDFSLNTLRTLAPGVLAVTILALTEAISIARAMALRSGQSINANQEFISQGLSNMVGSFFSSYVATGSFNRSGLNYDSGAKTPMAAFLSGMLLIGLVALVAPLAAALPHAAMAAVLFLVAWGLLDWHHIFHTFQTSRSETSIMIATFLGTLFFNLEIAILFGVMLSLGIYLSRTSNPKVIARIPDPNHPHRRFTTPENDAQLCPQIRLLRIDGSLFFGAIPSVQEQIESLAPPHTQLVVVASGINFIDLAGADFLTNMAQKQRNTGGNLYLVRLKEGPESLLEKGHYLDIIGKENLFRSKETAIQAAFARMDSNPCAQCSINMFLECHGQAGRIHSNAA